MAGLFGYDAGTAAGLVAGSLTESATIGTAMDAIARLDLAEAERTALNNNIPVAFAVTYLVGVIGAAWVLSQLAPKLLRVDLAEECRKLEEQMQGGTAVAGRPRGASSSCAPTPSIRDPVSSGAASPTSSRPRLARGSSSSRCAAAARSSTRRDVQALQAGDVMAVSGPRTTLVEVLEAPGSGLREVDDRELLDLPSDMRRRRRDEQGRSTVGRSPISRGTRCRAASSCGGSRGPEPTLGMLPDTGCTAATC